jgi:DNA-binding winged helix-turn-helix (wHTH) protein/tetratricopeptide (TPR) repeat protein
MADTESLRLRFDAFELDEGNALLTRDGKALPLAPKAFGVLCALARQPGQLITKDALLDAVWGHRHVSESVLKTTISELRAALADDARQPRYVETASRRGYRFIGVAGAAVSRDPPHAGTLSRQTAAPTNPTTALEPPPRMIGRKAALTKLRECWRKALAGKRQFVWITGEAGVGKTTLIKNLLAEVDPSLSVHGQCVEQFGAGEPYMPVLEVLGAVCRRDPGFPALLRAGAPAWLLQMPQFCSEADRKVLREQLAGSSQDRMMRELRDLSDVYSQEHPLLWVTEDLHWSDRGTLQLMNYIARGTEPCRAMWLSSFRLTEVIADDHPLKALRHELRLQNLVTEISLDTFSESEVGAYLLDRFPAVQVPENFVRTLHTHTDGLPLFLVNVIDHLVSQGALSPGEATLPASSAVTALQVPENLAGVIEKQMARLPAEQRALLEAVSVCGMEFRAQTVADALQRDAAWAGEQCEALAQQQQWLSSGAVVRLADGVLDARYTFRHALYRHVFYQRVGAATRAQMHWRIAQSMERGRTAGVAASAAELASHYELAHDPLMALRHYVDAVDSALQRFAPTEALSVSAHALTLVPKCPQGNERLELELKLSGDRGVAASQLLGVGSPEARAAFERTQVLTGLLPPAPARASELSGLGWIHFSRGEYADANKIGERLHALAASRGDPVLRVTASNLLGTVASHFGQLKESKRLLEECLEGCRELGERMRTAPFIVDPEVSARANLSLPLAQMGLIDQARQHIDAALARADAIDHPMAQMWALWWAASLAYRLGEVDKLAHFGERLQATVGSRSLAQGEGPGLWLRGWALARRGEPDTGYGMIMQGHARHTRLGMFSGQVSVLGYATEALMLGGRWQEAGKHVDDALALALRLDERIYIPDLLLLQGRIALEQGDADAARAAMQAALEEARGQDALWMELSALVALNELEKTTREDRAALKSARGRLSEGLDTDLVKRADKHLRR